LTHVNAAPRPEARSGRNQARGCSGGPLAFVASAPRSGKLPPPGQTRAQTASAGQRFLDDFRDEPAAPRSCVSVTWRGHARPCAGFGWGHLCTPSTLGLWRTNGRRLYSAEYQPARPRNQPRRHPASASGRTPRVCVRPFFSSPQSEFPGQATSGASQTYAGRRGRLRPRPAVAALSSLDVPMILRSRTARGPRSCPAHPRVVVQALPVSWFLWYNFLTDVRVKKIAPPLRFRLVGPLRGIVSL